MKQYTEKTMPRGEQYIECISEDGTISLIPCDPANSDYQRYLRWLENPNETEGGLI